MNNALVVPIDINSPVGYCEKCKQIVNFYEEDEVDDDGSYQCDGQFCPMCHEQVDRCLA